MRNPGDFASASKQSTCANSPVRTDSLALESSHCQPESLSTGRRLRHGWRQAVSLFCWLCRESAAEYLLPALPGLCQRRRSTPSRSACRRSPRVRRSRAAGLRESFAECRCQCFGLSVERKRGLRRSTRGRQTKRFLIASVLVRWRTFLPVPKLALPGQEFRLLHRQIVLGKLPARRPYTIEIGIVAIHYRPALCSITPAEELRRTPRFATSSATDASMLRRRRSR
jgi:hypothetical protein